MRVDDLIALLKQARVEHGNLQVYIRTDSAYEGLWNEPVASVTYVYKDTGYSATENTIRIEGEH